MLNGFGSLSRILDCSVDNPRGAKLWGGDEAVVGDRAGDGGKLPLPAPGMASVGDGFISMLDEAHTLQIFRQGRVVEDNVLHLLHIRSRESRSCSGGSEDARGYVEELQFVEGR